MGERVKLTGALFGILRRAERSDIEFRLGTPASVRALGLVSGGFLEVSGVRVGRLRYSITPAGRQALKDQETHNGD